VHLADGGGGKGKPIKGCKQRGPFWTEGVGEDSLTE
jgi:hypothetical protein